MTFRWLDGRDGAIDQPKPRLIKLSELSDGLNRMSSEKSVLMKGPNSTLAEVEAGP